EKRKPRFMRMTCSAGRRHAGTFGSWRATDPASEIMVRWSTGPWTYAPRLGNGAPPYRARWQRTTELDPLIRNWRLLAARGVLAIWRPVVPVYVFDGAAGVSSRTSTGARIAAVEYSVRRATH